MRVLYTGGVVGEQVSTFYNGLLPLPPPLLLSRCSSALPFLRKRQKIRLSYTVRSGGARLVLGEKSLAKVIPGLMSVPDLSSVKVMRENGNRLSAKQRIETKYSRGRLDIR